MNILLVVILAYTLAQFSWRLFPISENTMVMTAMPVPPRSVPPSTATANLDQLAKLHLFGNAETPSNLAPVPVSAPETRLNLNLKGLLSQSSQHEAMAIIAEGSTNEQVFRVGDSLSGGAMVYEIRADRVILSRAGRFETLTLPRERLDNPQITTPIGSGAPLPQQLGELRSNLIKNPADAMRLINAEPVFEANKLQGYRVRPGQDRQMFTRIGLQPGDIVTSINGMPLDDPAKLTQIYQQLSSANSLSILIERQGTQTELNLDLE